MGTARGEEPAAPWTVLGLEFRVWTLMLVALHVMVGLLLYEPILHPGGDNAIYMIVGEALRMAQGYRDLYLPGEPVHTKYPPLYPVFLAILGFFGSVQLFKLASLALAAGAVALTAAVGRRLVGEGPALVAAGLMAVNPVLLDYSHWVLSEAPFLFLLLLSLYWLTRADTVGGTGSAGTRLLILGTAAALGAFFTRTAGLPLLVAVPIVAWLGGRHRGALGAAAAGGTAMLAWAAFQRLWAPERAGYLEELVLKNPYEPAAGTVGVADLLVRTAGNVWAYVSEVLPAALTGIPAATVPGWATVLGLLVAGLAMAGWVDRATRRLGAPEVFAVLYVGLISVWPEVWTDVRFLLPLLPLILLYAARAVFGLATRWGGGGSSTLFALALLAVLLAVPALRSASDLAPERIRCLAAWRAGTPCDPPAFASLYAAARWTAEHTPPNAVVVNRKPSLFYWYGRRKGDVYPFSSDPDVVLAGLEAMGTDYVIVAQVSGTTFRYLLPAIEAHRTRFELVHQTGDPATLVLRFLPPPRTAVRPEDGP